MRRRVGKSAADRDEMCIRDREQEIQELDVQLSDTSDYAQLKVLSERREAAESELESKTERWMELSEKQS